MSKYIEIPQHKKPYIRQKAKDVFEQDVLGFGIGDDVSWGGFNPMVVVEEIAKKEPQKQAKSVKQRKEQLPYNHDEMHLGREFKSFHEVTDTLGWERTKSGSNKRIAQEKTIAQYCRLERVPNTKSKYHIVEVFDVMKPKLDKRKNVDVSLINDSVQKQIMLVLANEVMKRKAQSPNNHVYLDQQFTFSTGQLIEYVGLVNPNFRSIRHDIKSYSLDHRLNERHVSDIVNSTNNNAKNIVKSTLNSLDGRYLSYTEGINISFEKPYDELTGEYEYVQDKFATINQISFIKVLCERTVLNYYGMNSVKDIFSPIKNTKKITLARFYSDVVKLAKKLCVATDENGKPLFSYEIQLLEDMEYYYSSYQIATFVPILEEFKENNQLTSSEKRAIATLFNQDDYSKYLATLGDTQKVNDMSFNRTVELAKNRCKNNSKGNYDYRNTMTDNIIEKIANDSIRIRYTKTNENRVFENLKQFANAEQPKQTYVISDTTTIELDSSDLMIVVDDTLATNNEIEFDVKGNVMFMSEETLQAFISVNKLLKEQGISVMEQLNAHVPS